MQDTAHIQDLLATCPPLYPIGSDEHMAAALGDIFRLFAHQLENRASLLAEQKKRGWKSTGDALRFAATEIKATADELLAYAVNVPASRIAVAQAEAIVAEAAAAEEMHELHANQCTSTSAGERCMLPAAPPHTGVHIGTKGGRWPQVAEPEVPAAISEFAAMAEAAKASMAPSAPPIPRPRQQITAAGDGYEIVATGAVAVLEHATVTDGGVMLSVDPMPGMWEPADIIGGQTDMVMDNTMARFTIIGTVPSDGGPRERPAPPLSPFGAPVPGAPKAYQSPSSIEAMAGCGMKYRLKYRDGVGSDRPAWYSIGGTIVHAVYEQIEKACLTGTGFTVDYAPSQLEAAGSVLFRNQLAKVVAEQEAATGVPADKWRVNSKGEGLTWWRDQGETMVRSYLHWRPNWLHKWELLTDPMGNPVQEYKVEAVFGGVSMLGYIDSAWISKAQPDVPAAEHRKIHVLDTKSGTHKPEDPLQLQFYAAALEQMGAGQLAPGGIEGSNLMTRKMEQTPTVGLDGATEALAYRAQATAAADAAGIYLPRPSNMCNTCDVAHACPIMAKLVRP